MIFTGETEVLLVTAATIGSIHTLVGPDHYVPFIMMAKAGKWSRAKTALITFLAGLGHIGSSVLIGLVGVAFGVVLKKLEVFESMRGNMAAWMLTSFGFAYLIWGVHRAIKNRPHIHGHTHGTEELHLHEHSHEDGHIHVHDGGKPDIKPWIIFSIVVFGPCEPLIPVLMYPAAKASVTAMMLVTGVFAAATITMMLALVFLGLAGLDMLPLKKIERYSHAMAGAAILFCGLAVLFLGL